MSLQIKHYFSVKHGQIQWHIPDLLQQDVMSLEGQEGYCILKKREKKASVSQYGYYRGCILVCCFKSEMFNALSNKDEVHDLYFSPKFLRYRKLATIGGKEKEVWAVRSLADLNVPEMSDFISRVLAECAELGIEVPPSEIYYNRFYQDKR